MPGYALPNAPGTTIRGERRRLALEDRCAADPRWKRDRPSFTSQECPHRDQDLSRAFTRGHSTRSHRDEERAFSAICWRYGNSISSRLYPQSLSSLASRETGGEVSQRAGRGARLPHRVAPVLEPMNRCGYSFRQNLRKVQLEGSKPELKRMDGWMDKWMDG